MFLYEENKGYDMTINSNDEITREYQTDENSKRADYLARMRKHQQEQETFIRAIILMFIIFVCVVGAIFIFAGNSEFMKEQFGEDSFVTKLFNKVNKDNDYKEKAEFSLPFGPRKQNILLLGVDASENKNDLWTGTRTDTIILVNIDPKSKSVNAISIPRDSKVYLPDNHGIQKINAAHAIGGIGMTIRTIEDTLGVKIDRYLMVHDDAVKAIVEVLGGVTVYVEKPMRYHDYAGKLHIDLAKGEQRLNAEQAVGYLRFRHDPLGDIGRTHRQQWFLRGLLNELQKPETITKIPEIINVTKTYVKTNMSLYELSQYAAMTKHIDMDKIEVSMLPGAPNKKGYISYWIIDPQKTQEVVNRLIYREKIHPDENMVLSAGVMYAPTKADEAEIVKNELTAAGINISCTGQLSKTHTQFIAHSSKVTNEYYNWLKKKSPSIAGYQFVYEPVNYYCGESDFTIVVAGK